MKDKYCKDYRVLRVVQGLREHIVAVGVDLVVVLVAVVRPQLEAQILLEVHQHRAARAGDHQDGHQLDQLQGHHDCKVLYHDRRLVVGFNFIP